MTINITKLARLAHIALTDEEKAHYEQEIGNIMQWIEQLGEVNTDNVPQLTSVADMQLRWRKDEVTDGHKQQDILKNAPASEYGCFAVPKVME